ncbi:histidyl-tRNA synthetase [Zychaea mexicana]|uniref:histidyl-tRNA synthetase n=1 Tax=Zychaea mexicana TaxID=64656 RepID=UPI0022FDEBCB|nr:histidyl-tRNA synthetase [Zychaea mexicana]KAI9485031.1 histidyl-tRNA synthetase [Zychaea mexicana]
MGNSCSCQIINSRYRQIVRLPSNWLLPALQTNRRHYSSQEHQQPKSIVLKTPKGTKDYSDREMAIRAKVFDTITRIFKKHGAVTIDTPVFELTEILAGKYGEDSKLIYDLADQGGESCSLRYDLTVPFARFVAMNGKEYQNIKRYHIGKVYRRDQPAMTKGRLREFYQCDFDIAGTYDPMIPDAEVLRILCEALTALQIGPYTIKINHRKILDGIFEVCEVPQADIRSISSAVDKLDKLPWDEVKREMVEERGLSTSVADSIGEYVKLQGGKELLDLLSKDQGIINNKTAMQGLADMRLLYDYLEVLDVQDKLRLDLSLARGLDYYTGVIYEAITPASTEGGVGSVAAGGRYDDLVGMFAGRNKKGQPSMKVPCVGVSLGVERIFSILAAHQKGQQVKSKETEVLIIAVGRDLIKEQMRLAKDLWDNNIKASFMFKNKPKLEKQWAMCEKDQIPFAVIIGQDELDAKQVRLKDMRIKDKAQGGGIMLQRADLVKELKTRLKDF